MSRRATINGMSGFTPYQLDLAKASTLVERTTWNPAGAVDLLAPTWLGEGVLPLAAAQDIGAITGGVGPLDTVTSIALGMWRVTVEIPLNQWAKTTLVSAIPRLPDRCNPRQAPLLPALTAAVNAINDQLDQYSKLRDAALAHRLADEENNLVHTRVRYTLDKDTLVTALTAAMLPQLWATPSPEPDWEPFRNTTTATTLAVREAVRSGALGVQPDYREAPEYLTAADRKVGASLIPAGHPFIETVDFHQAPLVVGVRAGYRRAGTFGLLSKPYPPELTTSDLADSPLDGLIHCVETATKLMNATFYEHTNEFRKGI